MGGVTTTTIMQKQLDVDHVLKTNKHAGVYRVSTNPAEKAQQLKAAKASGLDVVPFQQNGDSYILAGRGLPSGGLTHPGTNVSVTYNGKRGDVNGEVISKPNSFWEITGKNMKPAGVSLTGFWAVLFAGVIEGGNSSLIGKLIIGSGLATVLAFGYGVVRAIQEGSKVKEFSLDKDLFKRLPN